MSYLVFRFEWYAGMIARIMCLLLAVLVGTIEPASANSDDEECPSHGIKFYEDNPTHYDSNTEIPTWLISTPKDEKMDAARLNCGVWELSQDSAVLSMLVARNGKLIVERYFNGSAANHSNNIHSASKSILSALVGIAIKEEHISGVDEKISNFLPDHVFKGNSLPDNGFENKKEITIANLLTMSAGLEWCEDTTEKVIQSKPDWVKAILSREMTEDERGIKFHYNTGLTHILSAVLTNAVGTSTSEYAKRKLFAPLGITAEHWGRDPMGINSGGYNLYLTPREMAKFGQLYLQDGCLQDGCLPKDQIVPKNWIDKSWKSHKAIRYCSYCDNYKQNQAKCDCVYVCKEQFQHYDYGYLWWLVGKDISKNRKYDIVYAEGYGGQYIYIIPELKIVGVITANTAVGEPFEIEIDEFVRKYIMSAVR